MDSKVIKTWSVYVKSIARVTLSEKNMLNPLQTVDFGTAKQFPNEGFVSMTCGYKPASSCDHLRLDRMYDLVLVDPNISMDTNLLKIDLDCAIGDIKALIDQDSRKPIDHDVFISEMTNVYQNLRKTQEDVERRLNRSLEY
jgi:hypothetical protein